MKRLQQRYHAAALPPLQRRGVARQRLQRDSEHALRGHIVTFTQWTERLHLSVPETAALLHVAPRTLRHWLNTRIEIAHALPLGRPTLRAPRAERMAVLALLDELGPATSVAALRGLCPLLGRAELEDLVRRYRRVWRRRYAQAPHLLLWTVPGAVWAADFAEPPQPIDGIFPYLLAVRDLASGQQLLWLPVLDVSAAELQRALASLFRLWGTPLVLKSDNGPAFTADDTAVFLAQSRVHHLFSPPYTPQYNGAIEAAVGSLKTRTERHAARNGRSTAWTADDVAAASLEANATARPRGPSGGNPDHLWESRTPIHADERDRFAAAVARHHAQVYAHEVPMGAVISDAEQRRLQRVVIRRALGELGYLLFSRRPIPLPITAQKTANIP